MVAFDDTCKKQRCGDHPGLRFELNSFAHRVARPRRVGGRGAASSAGYAATASIGGIAGRNRASRRRFCAVAASRNSSLAPHGPRSRNRPSPRMRLRWANSISTFFRRRQATSYSGVAASARATSRASSSTSPRNLARDRHSGSTAL